MMAKTTQEQARVYAYSHSNIKMKVIIPVQWWILMDYGVPLLLMLIWIGKLEVSVLKLVNLKVCISLNFDANFYRK